VINGKITFSTFHACKGRQRKHVFVVGFDQSYFSTYARNIDSTKCPEHDVCCGDEAIDRLYLMEADQYATDRPLEFLKMTHHEMKKQDYIEFRNPRSILRNTPQKPDYEDRLRPDAVYTTDLIKFFESVIETISPLLERIFVKADGLRQFNGRVREHGG
jgi:hypothetical protein